MIELNISSASSWSNNRYRDLMLMYIKHGRGTHPHGIFSKLSIPLIHPRESADYVPPTKEIIAEVLYVVRPFVYVCSRIISSEGSWRPFMISLLLDIFSKWCLARYAELSPNQRFEVTRRLSLFSYYLLRSPLFDHYTKVPLVKTGQFLSSIPVFGVFFNNVLDLILTLQTHYFYTSAS